MVFIDVFFFLAQGMPRKATKRPLGGCSNINPNVKTVAGRENLPIDKSRKTIKGISYIPQDRKRGRVITRETLCEPIVEIIQVT